MEAVDDVDKAQTSRWNIYSTKSEQRNLLNLDIDLEQLTLCTHGSSGQELLCDTHLHLLRGRKYGLLGRNGVGKTTLLQHIAQHKIVGIFDHMRCIYVGDGTAVGMNDDGMTAVTFLLQQHKERLQAMAELEKVLEGADEVDIEVLENVSERLRLLQADSAESRGRKILHGLGLECDVAMASLSGGWRHRVALASALFLEADVLLLDEPTNHLDITAICWLEDFLTTYKSTVVAVTHDHQFLDAFTTDIIEFCNKQLTYFKGDFSGYLTTRAQQLEKHQRMYHAQEARRRRWEATMERLRMRGGQVGLIRAREAQLKNRLGASLDGTYWKYGLMGPRPEILAPPTEEPFLFTLVTDLSDIPLCKEGEMSLVTAKGLEYTFPGQTKPCFKGVDLVLTVSVRLGLIGRNGTGKTTLLRCLVGDLQPTGGSTETWDGLRVGVFEQFAVRTLVSEEPAIQWLHTRHSELQPQELRDLLGSFGLLGLLAESQPLNTLSDGQKARVLFADMMAVKPHLIFLDEPTSHLDAETSAAITSAIDEFEGGVIIASHDRTLLNTVATHLLCLDPERFGPFEGTIDNYKKAIVKADFAAEETKQPTAARSATIPASAPAKQSNVQQQPQTEHQQQPAKAIVKCRHCGGDHFSHSCPDNRQIKGHTMESDLFKKEMAEAKGEATKPPPKHKVPLVEKASDGQGDWKISMSKSALKRLQQGK